MDLHLLKEDDDSYEVGHPKTGKKMKIPKKGLSPKAHELIKLMKPQHFDEGGEAVAPAQEWIDNARDAIGNVFTAPPAADSSDAAKVLGYPQPAIAPVAPVAPVQAEAPQAPVAPVAPQQDPLVQNKLDTEGILDRQQSAIEDYQKSVGANANNEAGIYGNYAAKMDTQQTPDKIAQEYKIKDDALIKAYTNNQIDPDRYIKNMSTGSRIASGIAMILGGASAGTLGGENPAVVAMNRAINHDIDAQKNSQDKTMNLYRMNHQALGDEMQAHIATQNQLWSGVQAKILGAQAQMQAPQAKLNAAKAISEIEQRKVQNRMMLGLLNQGTNGNGLSKADPSQLVETMVSDPAAKKQVYEEIGKAQNIGMNGQKMLDYFDQAAKENTLLRTGAGLVRTPGAVLALHQTMLPNFKTIDGTVRQAAMDESFHNLTPAPGDSDAKIQAKRQALQDWMHSEIAAPTAKGHGIDVNHFISTSSDPAAHLNAQQQQYLNWARANPSNPKAQIVLKKLGVQ